MAPRRPVLLLGLTLLLAACGAQVYDVSYRRPGASPLGEQRALVAVGPFADRRGEAPTYLGTIRGGFGNPVKTLETPRPVAEVVRQAYADGLAARGLLAAGPAAPYLLSGTIDEFYADRYVRSESTARILVTLVETGSGRTVVAQRPFAAQVVRGSVLALNNGVFASVEGLRDVAADALREAVDKTLADPAFAAAVP